MSLKIKLLFFVFSIFFIQSCATSYQGTEQTVTFKSHPNGAFVKTSHGYSCSITPCKIKLPRNKSFEAKISKPGFTTEIINVKSAPSGPGAVGVVSSALIGGVIASGYDIYKGGIFELTPTEINVKMQSTNALVLEEIRSISNMGLFNN